MTEHSKLGGSGAERWINCPGSVGLLNKLDLPPSDEPEYRKLGVAAHEVAAWCLTNGTEAWEAIGGGFGDAISCDDDMAKAVQVYLDFCNPMIAKCKEGQGESFIEHAIARPDVHPDYFGTLDFSYYDKPILHIVDYKHGRLPVAAEWNFQLMYYAYAKLRDYPDTKTIYLTIVQPRAFKHESVDTWMISRHDLDEWVSETLIPAMQRTATDSTLDAGPWCRWCPAKLVCPLVKGLFAAACNANPKEVLTVTDESLGRDYQYLEAAGFYIKALKEETLRRSLKGAHVPGTKLVPQKSNRIWKSGAQEVIVARLGDQAWTERELKSPAQIDKLDNGITSEWAFTPQTGLTIALERDKRPGVSIETASEALGEAGLKAAQELE